jgi:hypothetical protein
MASLDMTKYSSSAEKANTRGHSYYLVKNTSERMWLHVSLNLPIGGKWMEPESPLNYHR